MENVSNVSSEEELLQLRNEGKISEDEYEELLETLRKTAKADVGPASQEQSGPVRTCGLAIASLVLSLIGPIGSLPAVICGHIALRKIRKEASVKGFGLALAGLLIGYAVLAFSIFVFTPFLLLYYGLRADLGGDFALVELQHTRKEIATSELKQYSLDSTEGVLTQSGVTIDRQISGDGNGSLRIEAAEPITVRLFETGDIDIESARLIYQAEVRTENMDGQVYLEMLCHFPGKGEFLSRGLTRNITGNTDWTTVETPFFLRKEENPDNIKLNLVIDGKGTVWIDDIRLLKGALE